MTGIGFLRARIGGEGSRGGGAVQTRVARVVYIRVVLRPFVVPPPVFGPVGGHSETQSACPCRLGQFADNVTLRSHFGRIPTRKIRVVHGEAVAVLGDGNDVTGASLNEEIDPGVGVEALRFEERNEVLVAEGGLWSIGGDVVLKCFVAGDVHVAGIPLVSECRNGVHTPVEEDAELCVAKPVGCAVLGERVPGGVEGGVEIGWRGFGADFCDLALGVSDGILRRQRLRTEEWRKNDKKSC